VIGEKKCAMVGCRQVASPLPLVAELAHVGAFEVPLCWFCREPFERGLESLFDLVFDRAAVAA
jgi:hypothetical protein